MPDTMGHSVGAERFELLAKAAGNEVRQNVYCYLVQGSWKKTSPLF